MHFLFVVLAYVVGATPTSYWIGKRLHGIDLREHGSGNLGATNAFRVLGWRTAVPVVLIDAGKGFLPVWLLPAIAPGPVGWTLAYGAAAILGHASSFWVGFRGGKGVATSAGVFLALAPWAVLGGLVVWCALTLPTGYVSLGSVAAAALLPLLVAWTPHRGGSELVWFSVALAAFVIWAHRGNLGRLLYGRENRFGRHAGPGGRRGAADSGGGGHEPRTAGRRAGDTAELGAVDRPGGADAAGSAAPVGAVDPPAPRPESGA